MGALGLKAAVKKVIENHARLGLPIYVWRNGVVVEISPDELRTMAPSTQDEST
jgi:hypothetical protein